MTEQSKKYLSDIVRAIERQLGIIGEAVNKFDQLQPEFSLENARKIVGFRNRLIHTYDAVDPSMIWAIIVKYLPLLKEEVLQKIR